MGDEVGQNNLHIGPTLEQAQYFLQELT
jgi:hypothetical protein